MGRSGSSGMVGFGGGMAIGAGDSSWGGSIWINDKLSQSRGFRLSGNGGGIGAGGPLGNIAHHRSISVGT